MRDPALAPSVRINIGIPEQYVVDETLKLTSHAKIVKSHFIIHTLGGVSDLPFLSTTVSLVVPTHPTWKTSIKLCTITSFVSGAHLKAVNDDLHFSQLRKTVQRTDSS